MNEIESKAPEALIQEKITITNAETHAKSVNADTNLKQNEASTKEDAPEDPNWKAFREGRKKDREERKAAEEKAAQKEEEVKALKAAMEAAFSKQTPQVPDRNTYEEETEDQRIEKKVQAAIAVREAQAERARLEREHQEYPQRLMQQYPDFHNVIAQENLDYLDYHYPEVSRPLTRLNDGFDKWSDIYKAIKKFVPNHDNMKKDAAKAAANLSKPKSMSMASMTQTGQVGSPNILTAEKKAANWERMQKERRGL